MTEKMQPMQNRDSEAEVTYEAAGVLARHSSTFRWASYFLPKEDRRDATLLYAVCRLIDDTADETTSSERARRKLNRLRAEITGRAGPRPVVKSFLMMARRRDMELQPVLELIEGVGSDLAAVRIQTDAELVRYCYRVAGTVGLMMCSVMGVEDREARPHAIDLGVAMQLTNICRDVVEDAGRDRVYLPADRLRKVGVDQDQIASRNFDVHALGSVVKDVLALADVYYDSADAGMWAIPWRARFGILVASRVYRSIGVRLRRRGYDVSEPDPGPALWSLAYWTCIAASDWRSVSPPRSGGEHRQILHRPLQGLPGAQVR